MRQTSAILGALCAIFGTAHAQAAKLHKVPVGKIDRVISCEMARKYIADTPYDKITVQENTENMATFQKCTAEAISKKNERNNSPKRVLATGHYDPDRRIMIFGLVSVDPKDAKGIKQICQAAATTVGLSTPDPDIVSAAGSIGCSSYINAALRSDPLLLVAPTLIPGLDVTRDVLKAVGVPENTINDAERSLREAAGTAASTAVQTGVRTATYGLVNIDPEVRCATVFGNRVCR